ncbi:GMC oxidoreductase [Wolfiporia cocos MD-104 SS10]|uniref:GMC oxidoreductase n=1 Tax=Wolfiporia cocos (strain MD-104) TaxID=742152 RepID=A0A2H3J6F1_WOLCO|nr:GMC oxidoreductase [Wolfiporia cocos MD-104 SS10]
MWPFTTAYPQHALHALRAQYDYIVMGGGNAGCVLARRLSEDGQSTVLLVERGDAADSFLHSTPLLSIHQISDGRHSDILQSTDNTSLGRPVSLVCGKGLGGATRINGDQYTCGVPAEYNAWSRHGRVGWSYEEIKPYFKKSERWTGPVPQEYHGLDGPLQVRSFQEWNYESSRRAAEAARQIGFSDIIDMHSPFEPSIGFNKIQYTLDAAGTRQSSFRAYLPRSYVEAHKNLHVCTNVLAHKLEFSESDAGAIRAEGVMLQGIMGGQKRVITARKEIVLACGALHTPQLLMLSGVGPKDHLREQGIRVVKDLPGVGQYLQDHVIVQTKYACPLFDSLWAMVRRPLTLLWEIYSYVWRGTGWFLCTLAEVEIFGLSSLIDKEGKSSALTEEQLNPYNPDNLPDFAVFLAPIADPESAKMDKSKGCIGLNAALLVAKSKGSIRLSSSDPAAPPIYDMQYLTEPEDWAALRAALRVTVALAHSMRASGYPIDGLVVPDVSSDAALDKFIRAGADTMFHYTGSCRMAPEEDAHPGVVDDALRVHGIAGLRVADASVLPCTPATHPQALVYAIAEKCADMVRGDGAL